MSLLTHYNNLPRAARWGVLAVAGLAFYFVVVETAINQYNNWSTLADIKQTELRLHTDGKGDRDKKITTVNNGRRVFGEPALPGPEAERAQALQARIAAVLSKHGVRDHEEQGREFLLPPGPLTTALGTGVRVRRIARDVKFECTPDTMVAILADLEKSPEVSAISRVNVRKVAASGTRNTSARNLNVTLIVETWGLAGGGV